MGTFHTSSMAVGHWIAVLAVGGACAGMAAPAHANNYGESVAWQFQTSADKANAAMVQDMLQKRKSGYYSAPVYNTSIDRQYNCNLTANAVGNEGTNSTVANSPGTSGATAGAKGNDNASDSDVGNRGNSWVDTAQGNSGAVGSAVFGGTSSYVNGYATQALNSTQTNSGAQHASVSGSSACQFGAIN